jgi:hypothetical protein
MAFLDFCCTTGRPVRTCWAPIGPSFTPWALARACPVPFAPGLCADFPWLAPLLVMATLLDGDARRRTAHAAFPSCHGVLSLTGVQRSHARGEYAMQFVQSFCQPFMLPQPIRFVSGVHIFKIVRNPAVSRFWQFLPF